MASRKKRQIPSDKSNNQQDKSALFIGDMWALFGGVLAACIALVGQWFIGRSYSGEETQYLLQSINNSALWLGGSVVT
ncbi:MAG TPA: hypothetical protein VGC76_11235, partial [Pyrinomonadaceae bacterium]